MSERTSAIEIDRKLRDDFRRRLKDYGFSGETIDPVLAVLFRTFAHQLELLYDETGRIRLALLDELISGLGLAHRMARPAQTIVRMLNSNQQQLIPAGTGVNATAQSGEKLTFTTDVGIKISASRLAVVLTYQDNELQVLPAVEMSDALQSLRPSLNGVRCDLGPEPALFLAVDDLPETHLAAHSLFFELGPDAFRLHQALSTEPWCLVGNDGELTAKGVLRPARANAGARTLRFLLQGEDPGSSSAQSGDSAIADEGKEHELLSAILPDGFYAGRVFVFPSIPPDRRYSCNVPRGMETALHSIFGAGAHQAFGKRRVWVRVSMPRGKAKLQLMLHAIHLHAISVSDVECLNQTIRFDQHGFSIPISREAGSDRFLVAPLSIFGEADHSYVPELSPLSSPGVGRFGIRNGRIHIQPAWHDDGTPDQYVNIRVWSTAGKLGNSVGPGQISGFLRSADFPGVHLINLVSASGGNTGEDYSEAHARFASALLSRSRIVTEADLLRAVRAFDRRIIDVEVEPSLQRTPSGLRRLEKVVAKTKSTAFIEPAVELSILQEDLTRYLQQMVIHGTDVTVELACV